ncbi:MAG: glycosyltransferase [Acidiferrobacteraceae bacterium]
MGPRIADLAAASAFLWTLIALLPWQPWRVGESLDAEPSAPLEDLADVTVLIPARNEAKVITQTLAGLALQGSGLRVIVIDDESTDNTVAATRTVPLPQLTIISGKTPPSGWTGKLWALEQGRQEVVTPKVLLLDADIALDSGAISALRRKMDQEHLQLVSLMASPHMNSTWERLLMPAFVYFFKLLYPFRLSNSRGPVVAAAAGGCLLVETRVLNEIGGFAAIRGALIDDCSLARSVKAAGHRTWIGLSHSARMVRRNGFLDIWRMVTRTAYTQLRYSVALLLLCTVTLALAFIVPVAGLFASRESAAFSTVALALMALSYRPVLRFYGLSRAWTFSLPLAGTLYLAMTWASALGRRSHWRGRDYPRTASGTS